MRRGVLVLLVGLLEVGADAQGRGVPAPRNRNVSPVVEVRASVSRTALWPGDRVAYVVELVCAPAIDVLGEDLAGERLRLDGLELVSTSTHRTMRPDGRVSYRVEYELATYAVGAASLGIGELAVRYYHRGADRALDGAAVAGAVRVPAVALAWRSTLPDAAPSVSLRDHRAPPRFPRLLVVLAPLGWGLVIVSIVPVLLWTVRVAWRWRLRPTRRRGRASAALLADLDRLAAAELDAEHDRRDACRRLETLGRELAERVLGESVAALTADEVTARLRARGVPSAEALGELLTVCELGRYGAPSRVPSAGRIRDLVAVARTVLRERQR